MNRLHLVRILLPVTTLAVGAVAITVADQSAVPPSKNTTTVTRQASPEPSATPQVTVNGQRVPVAQDGTASVSLPSGEAKVHSSGNRTTVTTSNSATGTTTTTSGNDNLNVSVNSASNGGNAFGTTQVYSYGSSNDSSDSSSDTTVFATGESNVQVTH
jgi:hypothetical protein